jgi:hypothetical protein
MKCVSLVLLMAAVALVACPAFATVIGYQTAVQSDSGLTHRWSFDGADDAARLADGKGSAGLTQYNYGTSAPSVGLGVGGFDSSSAAAETKRTGPDDTGAGAGFRSAAITMGNTVTTEAIFKPTSTLEGPDHVGYIVANYDTDTRGYFLVQRNADGTPSTNNLNNVIGNSFYDNMQTVKSPLTENHWYFYAGSYAYDGSSITTINAWLADLTAGATSMTQVLNGVSVGGSFATGEVPLGIGIPGDTSSTDHAFPGLIDEVAVYGTALGGAAVQSHLDAILAPVPEPSTVASLITGLAALLAYAWRKRR